MLQSDPRSSLVAFVSFINGGGMHHYLLNLAQAIGTHVPAVAAVFGETGTPQQQGEVILPRAATRWRHVVFEKYNLLYYRQNAALLCRNHSPALVHITSDGPGILSFVRGLLKSGRVKVVYTMHDPLPHEERTTLWGRVFERYKALCQVPALLRALDAIHVHSEKHRQTISARYGISIAEKVYVVPHGGGLTPAILGGKSVPPEIAEQDLDGKYVVLFFGRIHPYKGLKYLLQAFRILHDRGMKLTLIIAGEGNPEDANLLDASGIILINRFIRDEEIGALFDAAGVVVLPYTAATQSGVVPMAYAYGKPVICSAVGALDEAVVPGQTGLLVPPGDAEALASAIGDLESSSLREQMGQAGRRFMETHLSWSKVASQHLEAYQRILHS